jgi:hypothetical protein
LKIAREVYKLGLVSWSPFDQPGCVFGYKAYYIFLEEVIFDGESDGGAKSWPGVCRVCSLLREEGLRVSPSYI